jgi:hypothetical protein
VASCCECGDEPQGSCATELILNFIQTRLNIRYREISNAESSCTLVHERNLTVFAEDKAEKPRALVRS